MGRIPTHGPGPVEVLEDIQAADTGTTRSDENLEVVSARSLGGVRAKAVPACPCGYQAPRPRSVIAGSRVLAKKAKFAFKLGVVILMFNRPRRDAFELFALGPACYLERYWAVI